VEFPLRYYANNTSKSSALIDSCVAEGVRHFIFSSTAAVYGMGNGQPAAESDPKEPINPYGRSKLMTEWVLKDAAHAHDFRYVALRYFNVAGADPKGRTGQSTPRATHLIKRACQVALGDGDELEIFGTDFPTPDGTGVRDYIHVSDLIAAHILALNHLKDGGEPKVLNCGYGRGFSVREVIDAVSSVAGRKLKVRIAPRRAGDPAQLIADSRRIKAELGWQPRHDSLEEIVATAFAWERARNNARV
jgi:UDP-glucose 4-epimerase